MVEPDRYPRIRSENVHTPKLRVAPHQGVLHPTIYRDASSYVIVGHP